MVAHKNGNTVHLISRQGKEFTQRFPELAKAVAALGAESVISSSSADSNGSGHVATPPMLMVFDLLELDGENQRKRPLRERRQALEHLLTGERVLLPVRRLSPNGLEAWQEVIRAGWQGLVAKDSDSPYVGGRTLKWLKVKQSHYQEGERGWEPQGKS